MSCKIQSITIRNFRLHDLDAVVETENKSFQRGFHRYTRKRFVHEYNNEHNVFIVATVRNKIAGYLIGNIHPKEIAELVSIAVHPDFRGLGIGHHLVASFLHNCKRFRVHTVYLYTIASNKKDVSFWKTNNFKPYKILKGYYNKQTDALCMMRKLKY